MKTIRCTYYGYREVYDVDLLTRMEEEIGKIIEANEQVEFLFHTTGAAYSAFMTAVLAAKAKYPGKVTTVYIAELNEEHGSFVNPKGAYFYYRYSGIWPFALFDEHRFAPEYAGKSTSDTPGNNMIRDRSVLHWLFSLCDYVLTCCYPGLDETENTEIGRLEKREKPTTVSLASAEISERAVSYIEDLEEREKGMLKGLLANKTLKEVGKEFGVTSSRVGQVAGRASKHIRDRLRIDFAGRAREQRKFWTCGLVGVGDNARSYTYDLNLLMQYFFENYRVQKVFVEDEICFCDCMGPLLAKRNRFGREVDYVAISALPDPKGEKGVVSYTPPYHELMTINAKSLDPDEIRLNIQKEVIRNSDFVIADLSESPYAQELLQCCAENDVSFVDLSKIP